jgi:2-polyprenyl-6-methoxyphenol hydroxylase-like FAD-dependent oxidoreductase
MLAQEREIEGPQRLSVSVGRCRTWSRPGLLLLGDAAHPMSPVRAQGVNLALRDAIVAANHLVPILRAGAGASAVDHAAMAVQREREPEIARAQQLQRIEAAGQAAARGNTAAYRAARRLAPLLGRYRWAKRAWLRRQRGLRHGVTTVELRV